MLLSLEKHNEDVFRMDTQLFSENFKKHGRRRAYGVTKIGYHVLL